MKGLGNLPKKRTQGIDRKDDRRAQKRMDALIEKVREMFNEETENKQR